jgi:hypothetical protein
MKCRIVFNMNEYIVEYNTTGGWFIKCDGSFIIQADNLEAAKIDARQRILTFTGFSTITCLEVWLKEPLL